MRADLAEQILAVAGLAGDLEARLLQQPPRMRLMRPTGYAG
jgi:hypothetical protein